jgi:integrase
MIKLTLLVEKHAHAPGRPVGLTYNNGVLTQYGKPFSVKALGMRMQEWTRLAGLAPGHTLHGLRKTLGKMLAEAEATTREVMAVLGHDDIAHAELYTREAEQKKLARAAMRKLAKRHGEPRG